MSRAKSLNSWLRRQAFTPREGKYCSRFLLKHSGAGRTGADISEHDGPPDPNSLDADQYIEVLQSALEGAGQDDANGFPVGSVQTYVIQAFFGERTKASARWPMRMTPESDEAIMGESEPPTNEGVLRQLMRHNEAIQKTANLGTTTLMAQMSDAMRQLASQNEFLMGERMETFKLVEDMQSQKHERELATLQHVQRAELTREGLEKIGPLVPHIVNRIAGKPLLKAADPIALALKQLMSTLKPEQLQGIFAQLSPEQQLALGAVLEPFAAGEGNGKADNEH